MTIAGDRVAKFTVDDYHRMMEAGILVERLFEMFACLYEN